MMKKMVSAAVLMVLAMVALAGCSGDKVEDPYLTTSLHQAFYGPLPASKGYKYKIRGAEVVESAGHLAMVRQGNVTEFIAGRSIEDKMEGYEGQSMIFNCVKKYTPYTLFKCEQLIAGNDTIFMPQAGSIYYPRITPVAEYKSKNHDEMNPLNIRYDRSEQLRKLEEEQFTFKAPVEWDHEEEEWYIVGPRARLRVEKPDDFTEIILRLLAKEGVDFEGGITYNETDEWEDRKDSQIAGTVTIDYITYMGKVFSG